MQRIVLVSLVAFMGLGLWVPSGAALHCNGEIIDIAGTAYIDQREDFDWIYLETNGQNGLQSGGENLYGYPETCHHPGPDMLVY